MPKGELNLLVGEQAPVDCHLMPCKIDDSGNSRQSVRAREYFWPTIRSLEPNGANDDEIKELKRPANYVNSADDQVLLASFRGRPLQGRSVKIPDGFQGHAIGNKVAQKAIGSKQPVEAQQHFDKFTYWNWDELPSKVDAVVKALGWLNVAKAIHEPIDE